MSNTMVCLVLYLGGLGCAQLLTIINTLLVLSLDMLLIFLFLNHFLKPFLNLPSSNENQVKGDKFLGYLFAEVPTILQLKPNLFVKIDSNFSFLTELN